MKNEMQSIKDSGFYSDVVTVATFATDDKDFKNMFLVKTVNKEYRFCQVDVSGIVCCVGDFYKTRKDALSSAYDYLTNVWSFKDSEITTEVKNAPRMKTKEITITDEELGALEYAKYILSDVNQTEMAEMHAFYLSKLLTKLSD